MIRKVECISTPYSYRSQSITDGKPVSSGPRQRKRGRSGLLKLDINRCRKIKCITTPYSKNSQSIRDGKPMCSSADGQTTNAIS